MTSCSDVKMLLTLKPLSKASCCAVCVGTGFGRDNTALALFVLFAVLMKGAKGVHEAAGSHPASE